MGQQDLTGKAHQIEPAYKVSGRGCRISRVENYRSYMRTRYQAVTTGSHGFETPDRTCLLGVGTALHDLTGSEHKSYMPTRYPDGAAGSHGFGTPDRTRLRSNRTGLQDLMGSDPQIVHAY